MVRGTQFGIWNGALQDLRTLVLALESRPASTAADVTSISMFRKGEGRFTTYTLQSLVLNVIRRVLNNLLVRVNVFTQGSSRSRKFVSEPLTEFARHTNLVSILRQWDVRIVVLRLMAGMGTKYCLVRVVLGAKDAGTLVAIPFGALLGNGGQHRRLLSRSIFYPFYVHYHPLVCSICASSNALTARPFIAP